MVQKQSAHHSFTNPTFSRRLKLVNSALQLLDAVSPELSARVLLRYFLKPRRQRETDYRQQLPPGARRITIFHNLTKLTGWAWGETGPAVLLVHDWEGHTGQIAALVKPLLAQGFRVVAFDAPGHGLSPSGATHIVDFGYAVQDVIEQHGAFYGIIAHSFGAAATAIMLAREPQLMPKKLVLLSPMRHLEQYLDRFAAVAGLSSGGKARLHELVESRVGLPMEQCSTVEAVRQFTIPGLIIHDRNDTLIPDAGSAEIARCWHGARLMTTEKLPLLDKEVLQHLTDFLKHDVPFNTSWRVIRASRSRVGGQCIRLGKRIG